MMRVLVLGCSARKRGGPHSPEYRAWLDERPPGRWPVEWFERQPPDLPALELYDGPAWRMVRAARLAPAQLRDVWAFSAKFGLIPALRTTPWYEMRMSPALKALFLEPEPDRQHWASHDLIQCVGTQTAVGWIDQRAVWRSLCRTADEILVVAGADYADVLRGWHASNLVEYAAGGIGEKLHRLRKWLNGLKKIDR